MDPTHDVLIRTCPFCNEFFSQSHGFDPSRTRPGMPWTDGSTSIGIKFNESLQQCEKCFNFFYEEYAKIVGIDRFYMPVKNGILDYSAWGIDDQPDKKVEDCFPNAPDLKGYKGSTIKYKSWGFTFYYLPFDGIAFDYRGSESFAVSSTDNLKEAVKKQVWSTLNQEFELRLKVWQRSGREIFEDITRIDNKRIFDDQTISDELKCFKDDVTEFSPIDLNSREYSQSYQRLKDFTHSNEDRENILRLLDIMDSVSGERVEDLELIIIKADMLRQTGSFDESLGLLKSLTPQDDIYSLTISLIAQSCRDEIKCVRKVYVNTTWW